MKKLKELISKNNINAWQMSIASAKAWSKTY